MRNIIVVDANIILSALLGGKSSFILFNSDFLFVTTDFTITEVEKYFPRLHKKLEISYEELKSALNYFPLQVYTKNFYQESIKESMELIGKIDKKDVDILALTLKLNTYLWTQDKHFEKVSDKIHVLKTENLI